LPNGYSFVCDDCVANFTDAEICVDRGWSRITPSLLHAAKDLSPDDERLSDLNQPLESFSRNDSPDPEHPRMAKIGSTKILSRLSFGGHH